MSVGSIVLSFFILFLSGVVHLEAADEWQQWETSGNFREESYFTHNQFMGGSVEIEVNDPQSDSVYHYSYPSSLLSVPGHDIESIKQTLVSRFPEVREISEFINSMDQASLDQLEELSIQAGKSIEESMGLEAYDYLVYPLLAGHTEKKHDAKLARIESFPRPDLSYPVRSYVYESNDQVNFSIIVAYTWNEASNQFICKNVKTYFALIGGVIERERILSELHKPILTETSCSFDFEDFVAKAQERIEAQNALIHGDAQSSEGEDVDLYFQRRRSIQKGIEKALFK